MERGGFGHYQSGNSNSFNVSVNSHNTTHFTTVTDEQSQILAWISPLEAWERHQDVSVTCIDGVGEWVLETAEFQEWRDDSKSGDSVARALFCRGNPGAGKTFISSLVIDTLCDSAVGSNVGIACLYRDYRGQEQVVVNMVGSLLRQFLSGLSEIPEGVTKPFRATRGHVGGRALQLEKLIEMFPQVLSSFDRTLICIDVLDEFAVENRAKFLQSLKLIADKCPNTRLFLTGRPHIQFELERHFARPTSVITIQPSPDDIQRYVTTRLDNDLEPDAMDDRLRDEILTSIAQKDSEIFLLVTLHMDAILGEITIGGRRERLHQMSDGLSDAYSVTVERIKKQRGDKPPSGMAALMWISLAERPLSVDELCHTLAVKAGTTDLDPANIPSIQSVLGCCLGLVTVDQETSTVRLIHATLQEYLRSQAGLFSSPHATIAEACLSYLSFPSVMGLSTASEFAPAAYPLLQYASCYWGFHAREGLTAFVKGLAVGVLNRYPEHVAANIFLVGHSRYRELGSAGYSGLHCAAYFGIHELVAMLLGTGKYEVDQKDSNGYTPLSLAAMKGHEGVVKILLDRADVNPNSAEMGDLTTLSLAAVYGHEGVVKRLLDRADVNPNKADSVGQTLLSFVIVGGMKEW